eukprot:gene10731-11878_t
MIGDPLVVFSEARLSTYSTKHVTLSVDRGVSWQDAMRRYEQRLGKMDGFYCSKREHKGRRLYILATEKEHAAHLFTICRPNTGLSPFEESKVDLLLKYKAVEPNEAESGWNKQYDKTETHCIHGPDCKSKLGCKVGCRTTELHLLCGGIISLLGTLESVVNRFAEGLGLTRENRTLRVVRVELDNGERLIGLKYPERLIPEVSRVFQEQNINADKDYALIKEDISRVVPNLKAKATTPPITLKTFFKIKEKNSIDVNSSPDLVEYGKENEFLETEKKIASGSSTATNVTNSEFLNKNTSEKREKQLGKRKGGFKRISSNSSIIESNKRHKQSNIMNSFKSKKEDKTPTCPICQKVFDLTLNNVEMNKHIDQCLIE